MRNEILRDLRLPDGSIAEEVTVHGFHPGGEYSHEELEAWATEATTLFSLVSTATNGQRNTLRETQLELGQIRKFGDMLSVAVFLRRKEEVARLILRYSESTKRLSNDFDKLDPLRGEYDPAWYDPNFTREALEVLSAVD